MKTWKEVTLDRLIDIGRVIQESIVFPTRSPNFTRSSQMNDWEVARNNLVSKYPFS
jgi:hypothetical protein